MPTRGLEHGRYAHAVFSENGSATTEAGRPVTRGSGVYVVPDTADATPPRRLVVDGKRLFRFMDAIYLDRPSEKLDVKSIQTLNAARRPLLARSDVNSTNAKVRSALATGVRAGGAKRVLEWGCGFHPMRSQLRGIRYVGLDIDPHVIRHNSLRVPLPWQRPFVLADAELDRLDDDSFDAVVSAFVLHFRLSRLHIETMRRVLRPGGFVLANVYRRSPRSRRELRAAFERARFSVDVHPDPAAMCDGHEFWTMTADRAGADCAGRAVAAVLASIGKKSRP